MADEEKHDAAYRAGVVDLLGVLAYGELTAFERLAEDAAMAPNLSDKAALAAMASAEFAHFVSLRDRLTDWGVGPDAAMEPFRQTFDDFHRHTRPADWWESLVKAYVGDGLAADFYREVATYVDEDTRELIVHTLDDTGHSEFVVPRVRGIVSTDARAAGRLALWGRRLVGEALSQAQMVVAQRDELSALLAGGAERPGMDLATVGRMMARLTEKHSARMASLGLSA